MIVVLRRRRVHVDLILVSALAMSAIACVGLIAAALKEAQLKALLLPLVAFAAGSLLGGALLHLLPEAVAANGPGIGTFLPALAGCSRCL